MLSEKMKKSIAGNSVIRSMFEEGKRLSAIYRADNVFDFSIGNPSVDPLKTLKRPLLKSWKQKTLIWFTAT